MNSPSFVTREIIDTEKSSYELWARIFRALADCESFAVEVRVRDGDGQILQVNFYTDQMGRPE